MFDIKDFKPVLDALVDVSIELNINSIKDSLSSDYNSDIKCYVFNHDASISIIAALKDDNDTEVKFRYKKKEKVYKMDFASTAKYRPELELVYMNEFEKVLKEANKLLGSAKKAYNTQIEKIYHKVLKETELREKRKTTCYIK